MTDFLQSKVDEIDARLEELRPALEEHRRLEAAKAALTGAIAPASKKASRPAANGSRGRGRPKGSGQRGQQAVALIRERPGITIPDLAEAMGIKQNYLYRLLPDLAEQGQVTKSGRGWHVR